MFLTVLHAKMRKEEEEVGLLLPVEKRRAQRECYPWYQLQLPCPEAWLTDVPAMGVLLKDWKWGADFLPAILRWLREL